MEDSDLWKLTRNNGMNCTPPAIEDFPRDLFTSQQRENGAVVLHAIASLYLFLSLAVVCDKYFVPAVEKICTALNVSNDVAGATFMAAATSAPELFVNVIGTFITEGDIGIGTIVGSAVFNILAVAACCGIGASMIVPLDWWPLTRDCLAYGITVSILICIIHDERVEWYEALILVLLYIVYIAVMYFDKSFQKCARGGVAHARKRKSQDTTGTLKSQCSPDNILNDPSTPLNIDHFQHNGNIKLQHIDAGINNESTINLELQVKSVPATSILHPDAVATVPPLPRIPSIKQTKTSSASSPPAPAAAATVTTATTSLASATPAPNIVATRKGTATSTSGSTTVIISTATTAAAVATTETAVPTNHDKVAMYSADDVNVNESQRAEGMDDECKANLDAPEEKDDERHSLCKYPFGKGWFRQLMWFITWPIYLVFAITIPDCEKPRLKKWFPLTFIMCIIWIGSLSYFVAWMITIIGDTLKIPDSVMGITFLAAGTSVPEAVSSVIVAKQGHGSMGISNSIGSNTFDILLCLGLPWLIKASFLPIKPGHHYVGINSAGLEYSAISLLSTLLMLYITFSLNKFRLDRKVGNACLIMYAVFLILASLIELNVFFQVNFPTCERESN